MLRIERNISDPHAIGVRLDEVVTWVRDAGKPFLDWLLGSSVESVIAEWLLRDSSELSLRHAMLALDDGRCIGGISALDGASLARARIADMQALVKATNPASRDALVARLRMSRDWFIPVAAEDLYITKVGVASSHRGRGLGKMLLNEVLGVGEDNGFRSFRLDVARDNEPAMALYRSAGFEVVGETRLEPLRVSYAAMRKEARGR